MGRFAKKIKKYERQFLLALVVILLLTFSVGSAFSCQNQQGAEGKDYGGDFLVSPSRREEIDNNEFVTWWRRLDPYRWNIPTPSLLYGTFLRQGGADRDGWRATWMHALPVRAAEAAGYQCGEDYQIKAAVRDAVETVMRGMPFNDATYDRFLREIYRRPASEFEEIISEVVLKDQFVRPLVETQRFGVSYAQAYEVWKGLLERVDLEYVALRGEDFTRAALEQERTRERIGAQVMLLDRVSKTARDMDVLANRIRQWGETHDGKLPESLDELSDARRKDAWGNELRYEVGGEGFELASAGPDGAFDSSDDVTRETAVQLKTRAALREVGDALRRWREARSAWPETVDAMREPPTEGALAPLTGQAMDGWDRDLVYEVPDGTESGVPRLTSAGPDGEPGTDDDVAAVVTEDGTVVPPGRAFVPWLLLEKEDVWNRPLRIDLAHALTWQWRVSSAGADGEFGTDDDLTDGNQREIELFYDRPEVKGEFEVPEKKDFEAVFVHLPLVPDDALVRLLEAYPQHAPDEEAAFDRWRQLHEYSYYMAEDPADPESGHGVEHVQRVAPDATPTLVPGGAVFGEAPEGFVGENDPDRKIYVERGWRPILLRETFLESLMNDLLTRARDSRDAVKAWEEKKAAFDSGESTEDPGERPEELTFSILLETELADFLPEEGAPRWLAYYRTAEPLPRADIENLTDLGDINLTLTPQGLKENGQYAATPDVLNDSHTKAIVHVIENHPRHDRPLEEIRDVIFDRFVESRRLDLAASRLEALKPQVEKVERETPVEPSEGGDEGEEPAEEKDAWAEALAAWRTELDAPVFVERTGRFIGARPPTSRVIGDEVDEDEAARIRRRDFVRTTGYDSVRANLSPGQTLVAGMLGRTVLRDDLTDGSDSVYLVRLVDVTYPPPAAFSPRDYADYLSVEILGGSRGGRRIGAAAGGTQVTGNLWEGLRHFYYDFEWLSSKLDLDTEVQPERPEE